MASIGCPDDKYAIYKATNNQEYLVDHEIDARSSAIFDCRSISEAIERLAGIRSAKARGLKSGRKDCKCRTCESKCVEYDGLLQELETMTTGLCLDCVKDSPDASKVSEVCTGH